MRKYVFTRGVSDIEARKKHERAMRNSEHALRRMFHLGPSKRDRRLAKLPRTDQLLLALYEEPLCITYKLSSLFALAESRTELDAFSIGQIRRSLRRMADLGLVSARSKGQNVLVSLTPRGWYLALRAMLALVELPKPIRWGELWYVVVFDVPKESSAARNALREHLKMLGLYCYQMSIWIYPHPCEEMIELLSKIYGGGKWVKLIVAKSITDEDKVRKYFQIR